MKHRRHHCRGCGTDLYFIESFEIIIRFGRLEARCPTCKYVTPIKADEFGYLELEETE